MRLLLRMCVLPFSSAQFSHHGFGHGLCKGLVCWHLCASNKRRYIYVVLTQSTPRLPEVRIVYRKNGIYLVLMGDKDIHT